MVKYIYSRLVVVLHNVIAKLSIFVLMKQLDARVDTQFVSSFLVHFD